MFNYFLDFLAHIIQYPAIQVDLAFIIKGPQGTGKNMFLEAFSTILGDGLYFSSSNPSDIFGEHATGAVQTLLVNFDEAEAIGVFANQYNKFRIKVGEKYMSNHNKVKKHFNKLFGNEIKFNKCNGFHVASFNVSQLNNFVKAKLRV